MSELDQIVFIIEDGQIIESAIRDLDGYIEETTTPRGVAPKMHIRGNELWTWGHQGSFPKLVEAFETEGEAEEALEDAHAWDFWNRGEFLVFNNRADAEQFLIDNADEE